MRPTLLPAAAALALGVLSAPRGYCLVPSMDLQDMASEAEAVVYGNVLSTESHWDDGHKLILTTVTMRPLEYYKGDLGWNPIRFDVPGGQVGDLRLTVSDTPEFRAGEEAVVFLNQDRSGVVGGVRGKVSVISGKIAGSRESVEEFGFKVVESAGSRWIRTRGGMRKSKRVVRLREPLPRAGTKGRPRSQRRENRESHRSTGMKEPRPGGGGRSPNVLITLLNETFEGAFPSGSWTLSDDGGTGHLWGRDSSWANQGTHSLWEAAGGSSALPPGANYANNMDTWAFYGPFDLSDAYDALVEFALSLKTSGGGDYIGYGWSTTGALFTVYTESGGDGSWNQKFMDLFPCLGDSSVWIGFEFVSDAAGTDQGAFIDDVEIIENVVTPASPAVAYITPDTAVAGMDTVTISGTHFGAAQGGSNVAFTKVSATEHFPLVFVNAGHVISWSDTAITCTVPVGASSGPVFVNKGLDFGAGMDLYVPYGYEGSKWPGAEPMGEDFLVNPHNNDGVPEADALDAIINGMQEWNAAGWAKFSFTYAGTTNANGASSNGKNEILFGTTPKSVASTFTWYVGAQTTEVDMVFNDTGYTFSASGAPLAYDIQSTATHELGHALGLADLYGYPDMMKTMYGTVNPGETQLSTIEADDILGVQGIYGQAGLDIVTRDLPDYIVPMVYDAFISFDGEPFSTTVELRPGSSLPPGFTMSSTGEVTGTPQQAGTFYFNARAVNSSTGHKDSQVVKFYIDQSVPVALEGFTARASTEGVQVEWEISPESSLGDFYVHRSATGEKGPYDLITEGPVRPSDKFGRRYSFVDDSVIPGTLYYYKIESREGTESRYFGPVSALAVGRQPLFRLDQNRPNPFVVKKDGATAIAFSLSRPGAAVLRVFDGRGRLVAVPFSAQARAGENVILWDGRGMGGVAVPSGVYFYTLDGPGGHAKKKMLVMR